MKRTYYFLFCFLLPITLFAQNKKVVNSASDLPNPYFYVRFLAGERFFNEPEHFRNLAQPLYDSLYMSLEKYEIRDAQTVSNYYLHLAYLSFGLQQDSEKLRHFLGLSRQFAIKKTDKLLAGYVLDVLILALNNTQTDTANLGFEFEKQLFDRLPKQPNKIEKEVINKTYLGFYYKSDLVEAGKQKRKKFEMDTQSEAYLKDKASYGKINQNDALNLCKSYITTKYIAPHRKIIEIAHEKWLKTVKTPEVSQENIWLERSVALTETDGKAPVIVAIWDTGVDIETVPESKRWTNPNEKLDGLDNDGNGCVDDIHGINFNIDNSADNALLSKQMLDSSDLKQLDSLVTDGKRTSDSITKPKLKYKKDGYYHNFIHGTHVAGIAAEGNPYVRIMVVRQETKNDSLNRKEREKSRLASKNEPNVSWEMLAIEESKKQAQSKRSIGLYLKTNKARIVNMSWTTPSKNDIRSHFTNTPNNQVIENIYNANRSAVYEVVNQSPEILFVAAAGNANDDPNFQEKFPAGFDLDNLIVVGAVDKAGNATSFTGTGAGIHVYADGFEVDSYVPGGTREKLSGTSMATPQVVNLAAKIWAIKPNLTVKQVKELIINNGDKNSEGHLLIHAKRTIEAVNKM
jgi:subtilisin family serine protease